MNTALRLGRGVAARDGQPAARAAATHGGDDAISEHDPGRTGSLAERQVDDAFGDYFRCPRTARVFPARADIGGPAGYFTLFGRVCYG